MQSELPILLENFFHAAIIAKVESENISIELDRDVAHGDPNSPVAFVFGLKQEKPYCYCAPARFWLYSPRAARCPTWRNFACKRTDMRYLPSLSVPRMSLYLAWSNSWSSTLIWQRIGFSAPLSRQGLVASYLFSKYWKYLGTVFYFFSFSRPGSGCYCLFCGSLAGLNSVGRGQSLFNWFQWCW